MEFLSREKNFKQWVSGLSGGDKFKNMNKTPTLKFVAQGSNGEPKPAMHVGVKSLVVKK